ncbi:hypothetical protein AOQ84DRAFT_406104, partial [Glonium stellatum]
CKRIYNCPQNPIIRIPEPSQSLRIQSHSQYEMDHHDQEDQDIISKWLHLDRKISAAAIMIMRAGFGDRRTQPKGELPVLTPDYLAFLNNASLKPYLIQGFVWDFLCERILGNSEVGTGNFWAEASEEAQSLRLNSNHRNDAELHRRRVGTAQSLQNHPKEIHQARVDSLGDALCGQLRQYLQNTSQNVEEVLRDIVVRCVNLDAEFQKKTAHYYVQTWESATPVPSNADLVEFETIRPGTSQRRPGSAVGRPGSAGGRPSSRASRPGSSSGPRPVSSAGKRPMTSSGRRPGTSSGARPGTSSARPRTAASRPATWYDSQNAISLVVRPALVKAGNKSGNSYGSRVTLSRASIFTNKSVEAHCGNGNLQNQTSPRSLKEAGRGLSNLATDDNNAESNGCCCNVM